MSGENQHKRKLEEEQQENKKLKQESPDINDDLNYLKESIKLEVLEIFENRLRQLEAEVRQLREAQQKRRVSEGKAVNGRVSSGVKLEPAASKPAINANFKPAVVDPIGSSGTEELSSSQSHVLEASKEEGSGANDKPRFGSNSFKFNTPLNSFSGNQSADNTPTAPNTSNSTPKPVFGATTSFGNSSVLENLKNRKSVFAQEPQNTSASDDTTAETKSHDAPKPASQPSFGTSSFGSNTKFNNAFEQALKKKSFLDEEKSPDQNHHSSLESQGGLNSDGKESSPVLQQYKQVDLDPVDEIKTGEEGEESIFSTTAKIFELDLSKLKEGWKERGLGPLHLNQSKEDRLQARLVMRSQGLLRVVLNMKITLQTQMFKGLEASLSPGKFLRLNSINAEGNPIQYLLKFSTETLRNELASKIDELKSKVN